jgi:carboxymethylenebutenolidase
VDPSTRQRAIDLYDRFTHDGMERRDFMAAMAKLAGSVAAAELLVAGIAPSPAAAAIVAENDPRLTTRNQALAGGYQAYVAEPRTRSLKATILVIHENRGLNNHIRDIARRLAIEGFRAVAPDMLSPTGGTPANEGAARDEIGKLDLGKSVSDAVAMLRELSQSSLGGKVGAVGFCWGGGFVDRLAVAAGSGLAAGVSYYGPAPDPSEAAKVTAPMIFHLAGLDARVGETAWPFAQALGRAGKTVEVFEYAGVNHAFNNDTAVDRYDKPAADLAWQRTLRFFRRHLG